MSEKKAKAKAKPKVRQPQKANKTSFKKGNKASEVWGTKSVIELFSEMLNNTRQMLNYIRNEEDENKPPFLIYCFTDVCISVGFRDSHINYLFRRFPDLADYKKDIKDTLISIINHGALVGERGGGFNSTASIWRMKMLGEKEVQEVKTETVNYNAEVSKEEAKRINDTLEDEY